MAVMSTGVHRPGIFGCILCSGLFSDRKGIHIEAQQKSGAWLGAFKQAYNACFSNAFGDFYAQCFQLFRHNTACAEFPESKFRVHVKITAECLCIFK